MGDWSVELFLAVAAAAGTVPKLLAFLLLMGLVLSRGTFRELAPADVTGNVGFILGGMCGAFVGGYLVGLAAPGETISWLVWVVAGVLLLAVWLGQIVGYFASFRVYSQDVLMGKRHNLFLYMSGNGVFWALVACMPVVIATLLVRAGVAIFG